MKYFTLDRIEGNLAVLLDDKGASFTESLERVLPAKEGDVLAFDGERYFVDESQTEEKKQKSKSLIDALFQ